MNLHKVMKRVICCVLTLGMVFSSTSFENTRQVFFQDATVLISCLTIS